MINTIVVAVDGSEHATKAARMAGDLAGRYNADVVLAHVVSGAPVPASLMHFVESEHLVERPTSNLKVANPVAGISRDLGLGTQSAAVAWAVGEAILAHADMEVRDAGATKTRHEVAQGDPADQIVDIADRAGADLVIIGTRGLGEVKALLLGSVSHKVAQLAPCPCMTVR